MRLRSIAPIPYAALAGTLLSLSLLLGTPPAAAQASEVAQGLALQAARGKFVVVKAKKAFYTRRWDMSGLPSYHPTQQVSGTIQMWGSNYIEDSNLGKYWEEGFRKYQPGTHIAFHMKTTVAAVPALNRRHHQKLREKQVHQRIVAPMQSSPPHSPQPKQHHRPE